MKIEKPDCQIGHFDAKPKAVQYVERLWAILRVLQTLLRYKFKTDQCAPSVTFKIAKKWVTKCYCMYYAWDFLAHSKFYFLISKILIQKSGSAELKKV